MPNPVPRRILSLITLTLYTLVQRSGRNNPKLHRPNCPHKREGVHQGKWGRERLRDRTKKGTNEKSLLTGEGLLFPAGLCGVLGLLRRDWEVRRVPTGHRSGHILLWDQHRLWILEGSDKYTRSGTWVRLTLIFDYSYILHLDRFLPKRPNKIPFSVHGGQIYIWFQMLSTKYLILLYHQ